MGLASDDMKEGIIERQKAEAKPSHTNDLLSGMRVGKSYRNFMAFILSVKQGGRAEMHGDGYVVLSRERYDELTRLR